jgi:hypothetical protein
MFCKSGWFSRTMTIGTGWWSMARLHRIARARHRRRPAGTPARPALPSSMSPTSRTVATPGLGKHRTQPPRRPILWPSRRRRFTRHRRRCAPGPGLLGHAGVDRRHGHAPPAQVGDDLARVPQRPDPAGVHRRSPSVHRRCLPTGRSWTHGRPTGRATGHKPSRSRASGAGRWAPIADVAAARRWGARLVTAVGRAANGASGTSPARR